jgi:hypothetical protein
MPVTSAAKQDAASTTTARRGEPGVPLGMGKIHRAHIATMKPSDVAVCFPA